MTWKPVLTTWEINEYGHIRNIYTKTMNKIRHRKDGYLDVRLSYKTYLVHRLVAIAFLPNPDNLAQVNHKNGVRDDAHVDNLEWVDQFGNMKHALANGLFPDRKGIANGRATITPEVASSIKQKIASGVPMTHIAKEFGVTYHVVTNLKRGLTWKDVA